MSQASLSRTHRPNRLSRLLRGAAALALTAAISPLALAADAVPADPNATAATKRLMKNLHRAIDEGKIIFGQNGGTLEGIEVLSDGTRRSWAATTRNTQRSDIKTIYGEHGGLMGFDIGPRVRRDAVVRKLIRENFNRGGLNALYWLMDNPATGGAHNDKPWIKPARYIGRGLSYKGRNVKAEWEKEIDNVSNFLKSLTVTRNGKTIAIPVTLRLYAEHNGPQFWWGSLNSAGYFKSMWRKTVERLQENGVHNVLYVYCPQFDLSFDDGLNYTDTFVSRWPGDQYVDIVGVDFYLGTNIREENYVTNRDQLAQTLRTVVAFAESQGKPAALCETGPYSGYQQAKVDDRYEDMWLRHILNGIERDNSTKRIAYCMAWKNGTPGYYHLPYTFVEGQGNVGIDDARKFFNKPRILMEKDTKSFGLYK